MNYFFDNPESRTALLDELRSWAGTPFAPRQAVKGGGVDCVHFVERALVNVGAMAAITWPNYVIHGGGAEMLAAFEKFMAGIPEFDNRGRNADLRTGDVLLCSTGRAYHHLGIVGVLPTVWHSLPSCGVCEGNVGEKLVREHLRSAYRVKRL